MPGLEAERLTHDPVLRLRHTEPERERAPLVVGEARLHCELHVRRRLRRQRERRGREQRGDHRESSRLVFSSHFSRAGISSSPYSSVSAP